MTYTKTQVIKNVRGSYFNGICDAELCEQTVVDGRHIDIMRKLYNMTMEPKIKNWLTRVDEFKKAPIRSHRLCDELIESFEEFKKLPEDATPELIAVQKTAESEYKQLLTLRF